MTALRDWLSTFEDRCAQGYHLTAQHPALCQCSESGDEWSIFTTALRSVVKAGPHWMGDTRCERTDRHIHQAELRPLIRGRIEPKHVGTLYRRARAAGLLAEVAHERSDDLVGKNAGRLEPVYEWLGAA